MIKDELIKRDAARSLELRRQIARLSPRPDQKIDSREIAAASLYEIASEHHSSIGLLLRFGRFASAQALLRSCVEASLRTVWLLTCTTQQEFEEVQVANKWPNLERVIGNVERVHRNGGFIRNLLPPRAILNDLAHGGFMQIADRLVPQFSKLNPNVVTPEDHQRKVAAMCIRIADRMLCFAAVSIHLSLGHPGVVQDIVDAHKRTLASYELGLK